MAFVSVLIWQVWLLKLHEWNRSGRNRRSVPPHEKARVLMKRLAATKETKPPTHGEIQGSLESSSLSDAATIVDQFNNVATSYLFRQRPLNMVSKQLVASEPDLPRREDCL